MQVDASDFTIGGALLLIVENGLQSLAFFFENLPKLNVLTSAHNRKLLATNAGIKHFRYMFKAKSFPLFKYHKSFMYTFQQHTDKCSLRQTR